MNEDPEIDKKLDDLFDRLDGWLHEGLFDLVDAELEAVQINEFHPALIIGYLTITLPAKNRLVNRSSFMVRAKKILSKQCGIQYTIDVFKNLS